MIQKGVLYTVDSTGTPTGVPIKGATIVFKQNNSVIKTAQTDVENGEYTIDLEPGKYLVEVAKGNITIAMRAGQLFDLKGSDGSDAFQKWLYSKSGDIDDQLLKSFKEIANQVNLSAESANQSANKAKDIADNFEIKITNDLIDDDEKIPSSGAVYRAMESKQDSLEFIGTGKTINESELTNISNKKRDIVDNVYDGRSGLHLKAERNILNNGMIIRADNPDDSYHAAILHVKDRALSGRHTFVTTEYGFVATREFVNSQLSDMRVKKDIKNISELELDAMRMIDFQSFRYREDQEYTNNKNTVFFGVIAQKVINAFKNVGLSAFDYNLVIDLRNRKPLHEQGDELTAMYGVNYINLLILEAEVNRKIRDYFENRLFKLEQQFLKIQPS